MRRMKNRTILIVSFLVAVICTGLLFATIKIGRAKADNVQTTEDLLEGRNIHVIGEDEVDEEAIYQALFNADNKVAFSIDISNEELKKLNDDFIKYDSMESESPIYRKANIVIAIEKDAYVIEEVGVRMKGNTSRTDFYTEEEGIYNLIHLKLNFKETFDDEEYYGEDAKQWESKEARKARKNRTFATLEKLDLKYNRTHDNTYTREYYAFQMFKDYGVLAANMNLSSVSFADSYFGVMYMYEPIDEKFIQRNLPQEEQGGDLYKAAWDNWEAENGGFDWHGAEYTRGMTYGIENEETAEFYNLDLKTNKKTSTHEALKNLINVINDSSVTEEAFKSVVDADNFAKFAAVSYFLGGPDDMRNNYNNHYVYFLPSSGKAIFIPYDYDICLGNAWSCDRADSMTNTSPYSILAEGSMSEQYNPLFILGIINEGFCKTEYDKYLADIVSSNWLDINNFKQYYDVFAKNYSDKVVKGKIYENFKDGKWAEFNLNAKDERSYDKSIAAYNVEEFFDEVKYEYQVANVNMHIFYYQKLVKYGTAYVGIIGDPGTFTITDEKGNVLASGNYENQNFISYGMDGIPFNGRIYFTLKSGEKTEVYEFVNKDIFSSETMEPEETNIPEQEETVKPEETNIPEQEETVKPEGTNKPEQEETVKPEETNKPSETTVPGGSSNNNQSNSNNNSKVEITKFDKNNVNIKEEYVPKSDGKDDYSTQKVETGSVNTGDESPITVFIIIAAVALVAMAVTTVVLIKNKK